MNPDVPEDQNRWMAYKGNQTLNSFQIEFGKLHRVQQEEKYRTKLQDWKREIKPSQAKRTGVNRQLEVKRLRKNNQDTENKPTITDRQARHCDVAFISETQKRRMAQLSLRNKKWQQVKDKKIFEKARYQFMKAKEHCYFNPKLL